MRNDIISKLYRELSKPVTEEIQVVYILSRIRKILEGDKNPPKFDALLFYCNWAMHVHINRTKAIDALLQDIQNATDGSDQTFTAFIPFHDNFRQFLNDYGLMTTIYDRQASLVLFNSLLVRIYSDTPLIIKSTPSRQLIMHQDGTHTIH